MTIKISLPQQVIVAAFLGIATGIFGGEYCTVFAPLGELYVMLLQAVVYPYIIATLIYSLGDLAPGFARKLFKHSWLFYACLIILSFIVIISLSFAIPKVISGLHLTGAELSHKPSLLKMLVPANIITALSFNYVPAVIVFCVLFGTMLQRVKQKQSFLNFLDTISKTSLEFWKWLVKFAPIATFALLANLSGTIELSQLSAFGEYILLFVIGALLLTFWLLPAIICSLTGLKYRKLMYGLREALILSAATTLSVIALPYVIKFMKELFQDKEVNKEESEEVAQTTLMISYPFAQIGNMFIYLFIMFALLYFNTGIFHHQSLVLPWMSYLTSIGSPSTTVNSIEFLAQWLNLPPETAQLFISSITFTRYLQVVLSVMGFSFMTILVSYAYYGFLRINYKALIFHIGLALALLLGTITLIQSLNPSPAIKKYNYVQSLSIPSSITAGVQSKVLKEALPEVNRTSTVDAFHRIKKNRILRVGYNPHMLPFSYFNTQKELVGYDVMFIYKLANSFDVDIEFIPYKLPSLIDDIRANKFDIAIGGLVVTPRRLLDINYTSSYYQTPYVLISNQNKVEKLNSALRNKNFSKLRIAIKDDPLYIAYAKKHYPKAELVVVDNFSKKLFQSNIDAALWLRVHAYFWVLKNNRFTMLPAFNEGYKSQLAYMVSKNSPLLLEYLNYFMQYEAKQTNQKLLFNEWIFGIPSSKDKQRWSIWRDIIQGQ